MQRQGSCNLCGQCCGADGSPEQDSPWPDNWPDTLRNWAQDYLETQIPIFKLVGNPHFGGLPNGIANIRGKKCYWIWITPIKDEEGHILEPGHGLCKDLPPYGDVFTYSEECPMLLPDPGDGTRPCALMGTQAQWIWEQLCQPQPPMEKTPEEVAIWQQRHPKCSYMWE